MDMLRDEDREICIYFSSFLGSMGMNYLKIRKMRTQFLFCVFCLQFRWLDHLNSLFAEYGISLNKSQNIIVSDPEYLLKMSEDVLATNDS